jgi:TolB protein
MRFSFLLFALVFMILPIAQAKAELRVDVTRGVSEPIPIAVTNFVAKDGAGADIANQIPQVITNNLVGTGLFKAIDPKSFIQDSASMQTEVRFNDWKTLNAQGLVVGAVTRANDGRLRVEFRLFDVYGQKQLAGTAYMTTPQNWRRIAHIISDEIYKRLTGEMGYFDSRIVYVAESGSPTNRIKRLAIMDQDGANNRFLTDGSNLVLTPRFSPNQHMITYLAYVNGKPRVFIYDLESGRQESLGDFPGMSFAPRFSPDGSRVIFSLAQNGNTDIYVMDLRSRNPRRLTNDSSIDTAPSYSPDGKQIVFESDRGGTQQLYVMSASGGEARRITFGQGRYASPVWSPRGDLIAFTRMHKGQFYIGVVRPDGSGERLITSAYHMEGPTWAPNGRVLAFFKEQTGRSARLFSIDLTGFNERPLKTSGDASDPAWSPINP